MKLWSIYIYGNLKIASLRDPETNRGKQFCMVFLTSFTFLEY